MFILTSHIVIKYDIKYITRINKSEISSFTKHFIRLSEDKFRETMLR